MNKELIEDVLVCLEDLHEYEVAYNVGDPEGTRNVFLRFLDSQVLEGYLPTDALLDTSERFENSLTS